MCFSVEVEKELKKLAKRFDAEMLLADEVFYQDLKKRSDDLDFVKRALNLSRKPSANIFKEAGEDNRVFPGYFTWVMVEENGARVFKRMRYRIRPAGSKEEIPTKFNVFNARFDSLNLRETWKRVFMKKHGIMPFTRFYEWVEFEGKKRLISFSPRNRDLMWAPVVYDYWENKDTGFGFYSFALITDDPPAEVLKAGHDRCPIFLQEDKFSQWLRPQNFTNEMMLALLKQKIEVYYENRWAA